MEAAMTSMNPLLKKLTEMLSEKYKLLKGLRKDVEFLESELRVMKEVLDTMADLEDLDPFNKRWRDVVREMSYDIEDCIDVALECLSPIDGINRKGLMSKLKEKLHKLKTSHKIALDIQGIKARIVTESERRSRYKIDLLSNKSNASVKVDPRMLAYWEETEKLVGIDGPRDELIGWLMPESYKELPQQVMTLSIIGCGGLGKTTLASQIYHEIRDEFQCAAFVTVSQRPVINDILMNIYFQVGAVASKSENLEHVINILREYLQHKRYCILVDDLWDIEPWNFIGAALVKNSPGSIIIITTRDKDVAESCQLSHGGRVHDMKCLDYADSKRLFFTRIFGCEEKCPLELVEASEDILSKCEGIPLAITSISSLLAVDVPQAAYHWNKVKECISSRVSGSKYLETMQSVLALSYFSLPHELRGCLLYFSMFAEDCEIYRDEIVSKWIAERLVSAREEETLQEAGVRYFNMLLSRSLIKPCEEHYGEVLSCRVHDVVLNFIVAKAAEENFVTLSDPLRLSSSSAASKVRRLFIQCRYLDDFVVPWKNIRPHLRSLSSRDMDCKELGPLSEFVVLRVLDLNGCRSLENSHLAAIQKLVQLRYLSIANTYVSELPASIGEARHLETLDIRSTKVKELPSGIALLQRLVRLLIDMHVKFPVGGLSKMKALEELSCISMSVQPVSFFKELCELAKLRVLVILCSLGTDEYDEHLKALASSLGVPGRHNLCSLQLDLGPLLKSSIFSNPQVPLPPFPVLKTLQKFRLRGDKYFPNWIGSSFVNLEHLELRIPQITLDDLRVLGGMPALEVLEAGQVHEQESLITITSSFGFQRLKFLRVDCIYLVFMPGSAPNLKELNMALELSMDGCDTGGIIHLASLTRVLMTVKGSDPDSVFCKVAELKSIVSAHPNLPQLRTRVNVNGPKIFLHA